VNDSADDDGSEYVCVCGSGYYEDTSSGECVSAATVVSSSSSSSSACSNCGGERGTCVHDADSDSDSDSGDESLPFCECSDGWYGTECSSICPVSDDLGLCSGSSRGTCDAATHTCVCESGYYGSSCNLYCDSLSRCGLHGRCSVDLSSSSSSEALYCECDAGWNGSTCFTQYPVETVEYVNDDDETNPTIVDYVCGINYTTIPSSSYSDYAIYTPNTDTYSCDCSSYGLITDASTSTCIDPATHPYYKDIAGNDTACLTCGTTTDSHGTCVLGEGEDSLTAMCQCEYGWGNDDSVATNDINDANNPTSSSSMCSVDVCGVETQSSSDTLCSSHGTCNLVVSSPSSSLPLFYECSCEEGWYGQSCAEEDSFWSLFVIIIFALSFIILIILIYVICSYCSFNRMKRSTSGNFVLSNRLDGEDKIRHSGTKWNHRKSTVTVKRRKKKTLLKHGNVTKDATNGIHSLHPSHPVHDAEEEMVSVLPSLIPIMVQPVHGPDINSSSCYELQDSKKSKKQSKKKAGKKSGKKSLKKLTKAKKSLPKDDMIKVKGKDPPEISSTESIHDSSGCGEDELQPQHDIMKPFKEMKEKRRKRRKEGKGKKGIRSRL
ncbi:hypothetical protein ADUPG1_007034, partial [Aduncisulcus paluster]